MKLATRKIDQVSSVVYCKHSIIPHLNRIYLWSMFREDVVYKEK